MLSYSRSHLADHVLLRTLAAIVTQDRVTTAEMLALIAEVDRRRAFRDEGYSSMYRYCVEELRMSRGYCLQAHPDRTGIQTLPAHPPRDRGGKPDDLDGDNTSPLPEDRSC